MIRLKTLIDETPWDEIQTDLLRLYPEISKHLSEYLQVYNKLKEMAAISVDDCELCIVPHDSNEKVLGRQWVPDNNTSEFRPEMVSLILTPWEEWLGMPIAEDSLQQFPFSEIVAYCVYEMTRMGFTEAAIHKQYQHLLQKNQQQNAGFATNFR